MPKKDSVEKALSDIKIIINSIKFLEKNKKDIINRCINEISIGTEDFSEFEYSINKHFEWIIEHMNNPYQANMSNSIIADNLSLLSEYINFYQAFIYYIDKSNIDENIKKQLEAYGHVLLKYYQNSYEAENLNSVIDRISIKNFKQFYSFEMKFKKNINIIIGQNSIGKTSLLQAITLGLLKENSYDIVNKNFPRYISKNREEIKSEIIIHHNNMKNRVEIFKEKRIVDNNFFTPFILAYGSSFFTEYSIDTSQIVKDILDETVKKDFVTSIFLDYTNKFWNPLNILKNLENNNHLKAKEKKNIIFNGINEFLEDYQLKKVKDEYFFEKKSDKSIFTLEELSEGYRSNILLITDMLIKILGVGKTPKTIEGIILIDEFDKHLHPRWQSKLVNQLTETFPKIQFIMTTHNPMSILDRESDEIIMLREIDGEIKAIKGRGTKNIGVSVVLLEYFNVDSTVGNTMNENINNFNRLKLKKELTSTDKEELQKLEKILGATVASNVIFDRKYLKFLEFIRDHKDIDFDKYEKINEDEMSEFLKDFGDFFDD